jgi:hypothetical protein
MRAIEQPGLFKVRNALIHIYLSINRLLSLTAMAFTPFLQTKHEILFKEKGRKRPGGEGSWVHFIPAVNGWAMDERLGYGNPRRENSD